MNKKIDNAIDLLILNLPKLYEEDIEAELLDLKKLIKSQQDKLDKIAEALTNMQIEYDESGYIATTLHSDTIEEQKRKFFKPIKSILDE